MPREPLRPYPNLDREGIAIPMDWEALAKLIVSQNYGFLRMCAAMTREVREKQKIGQTRFNADNSGVRYDTPLADAIEAAISRGAWE